MMVELAALRVKLPFITISKADDKGLFEMTVDSIRTAFPDSPGGKNTFGIGLLLDSNLVVQEMVPGGPAAASGVVEVGDTLVRVGGTNVEGRAPKDILCYVLGDENTICDIVVRKEGPPRLMVPVTMYRGRFARAGVGMKLSRTELGFLEVQELAHDGAAATAGVLVGDTIQEINGESMRYLTVRDAVPRLTGQKGTTVHVTLARRGEGGASPWTTTLNLRRGSSTPASTGLSPVPSINSPLRGSNGPNSNGTNSWLLSPASTMPGTPVMF
ncbi:hypothetical protein T484DRAFT_2888279 [Baffinella frigidus]|nr:hypothetical protein T484DRAFT_2888279 [Cryptophyta sp. CCMP2293]